MTDERSERIKQARQSQPIAELERKWNKAQGRWSRRYWAQEWLDLAAARAKEWSAWFMTNAHEVKP